MFDVAIYTDTRADEAVDGIDGFNFQAVSEGITGQDLQFIRDNLLHRVAAGWGVDHDPLSHPPSFVHMSHGGRHYLSRGISTGVTNTGRDGNLLTEAIVTPDADDFASMRPAQLFGAVNWQLRKAPGRTVAAWTPPLDLLPEFTVDGLREMVLEDPWAVEHLADYLTLVEQVGGPDSKRLVLLTTDALLAQRWIALGTLFVDAHKALEFTIRGLVADPMTARADIVAASPAFGPQPDPLTPHSAVNVVDLDRRVIAPVERTESAQTQSRWFLTEEAGVALAAVELARRWEEFLGRDLATRAAAVASFPQPRGGHDDWVVAMQALLGLAEAQQEDELFFYGDSLLDVAVTRAADTPADATLAGQTLLALLRADSMDLAVGVLMPTLEAVLAVPEARDAWLAVVAGAADVPRLAWEEQDARQRASAQVSAVVDEVGGATLPALFTAALTLNVPLDGSARSGGVSRLATVWARDPNLTQQCQHWAYGDEVVQHLADTLLEGWESGDQVLLGALTQGTWSWLPSSPALDGGAARTLASWRAAVGLAQLPVAQRTTALRSAGELPPQSWRVVWSRTALPADVEFFLAWVRTQRMLTAEAGTWLFGQVRTVLGTGLPAVSLRKLLTGLDAPEVEVAHQDLAAYAADVTQATAYFQHAARTQEVPNPYLQAVGTYLPDMAALMLDQLGDIIVGNVDHAGVARLVAANEEWAEAAVRYCLELHKRTAPEMASAIKWALVTMRGELDAPARGASDFLQDVCDSRRDLDLVSRATRDGLLEEETRAAFDDFVRDARRGRLKRRITRAASDWWGGKDRQN